MSLWEQFEDLVALAKRDPDGMSEYKWKQLVELGQRLNEETPDRKVQGVIAWAQSQISEPSP